jgi:hypothetical protein
MCVAPLDMSTSEGWPVAIDMLFALRQIGDSAQLPDIRFSTPGIVTEVCARCFACVSAVLRHPLTITKRANIGMRICSFMVFLLLTF